ncbi:hypothetical protein ACHWQZ_G014671 [Mnemiopsis leidyi]
MLLRAIPAIRPCCVRCLTHYEVLEIPRTATKADIKKSFLEKAKKYHPDLNPDDEMAAIKFREIQEAHDVLMSSKERAQYNHQLNQDTYYGSKSGDTPPRRSRVRTHGVNYRTSNGDYHDNHRVNRDNYTYPGNQSSYHGNQSSYYTDPYTSYMNTGISDQLHIVIMAGLAATGVVVYIVVKMVAGIKEEAMEGRHGKYKSVDNFWSRLSSNSPRSGSQPVSDTVKVSWSERQEKMVKTESFLAADLKNKFDSRIQSSLSEIEQEEEEIPVLENKPLTPTEISLLRINMNKKRSAYLAAKKEYTEKLELFNEEQKEKKTKSKKREVV